MWQDPDNYAEALELDSIDWSDDVVQDLVPLAQSAPPRASPEAEEIPARLPVRPVHTNGRLRGRAYFLTYSQTRIPRDVITQWFSRQPRMTRVIVGQEHHQDGHLHWHVTIQYDLQKDVRAATYFNIEGEHPNIGVWLASNPAKQTFEQWVKFHWDYCKKEDPTPFIVGEEPVAVSRKRKRDDVFTEAFAIARAQGANAAIKFLEENAPYDFATKHESICRTLIAIMNSATKTQAPARSVSDFNKAPTVIENWHCLYIDGPTGTGKTAWARSLLPEATVVRHRDQLRDCDFSKGVIFDDFDVGHWPPTAVIHLLDWDEPSGIDVKHAHVVIPAHTRKIFTHNREFERWIPDLATDEQISACRRRIHVINVHTKLYGSPPVEPEN